MILEVTTLGEKVMDTRMQDEISTSSHEAIHESDEDVSQHLYSIFSFKKDSISSLKVYTKGERCLPR